MRLLVLVLVPSLACSDGISGQTRWSQGHDCGGDRGLVQGGDSLTHHNGDAASLTRLESA
jgi:hypothetical protein